MSDNITHEKMVQMLDTYLHQAEATNCRVVCINLVELAEAVFSIPASAKQHGYAESKF